MDALGRRCLKCQLILNNLFHATSNRTAGHAGDPRHHAHTAITVGAGLSGGKPPPPPFIQNRRQFSVTSSNTGCRPDHPQTLSCCNPYLKYLFMHTALEKNPYIIVRGYWRPDST